MKKKKLLVIGDYLNGKNKTVVKIVNRIFKDKAVSPHFAVGYVPGLEGINDKPDVILIDVEQPYNGHGEEKPKHINLSQAGPHLVDYANEKFSNDPQNAPKIAYYTSVEPGKIRGGIECVDAYISLDSSEDTQADAINKLLDIK